MGWVPQWAQPGHSGVPFTSNDCDIPGLDRPGHFQRLSQEWDQVLHSVCHRSQDNNPNVVVLKILLVLQVLVSREEDVEG